MKKAVSYFVLGALGALPFAASAIPSDAQAASRRLLATSACQVGFSLSDVLTGAGGGTYGPTGVRGDGEITSSSLAACAIPTDSWFPHQNITQINVHIRRNTAADPYWRMGARACVQSYNSNSFACGQGVSASDALGEKTLSLTGATLNTIKDAAYNSWGPYLDVSFKQNDLLRFVYTAN